jgi:hypothetical protein
MSPEQRSNLPLKPRLLTERTPLMMASLDAFKKALTSPSKCLHGASIDFLNEVITLNRLSKFMGKEEKFADLVRPVFPELEKRGEEIDSIYAAGVTLEALSLILHFAPQRVIAERILDKRPEVVKKAEDFLIVAKILYPETDSYLKQPGYAIKKESLFIEALRKTHNTPPDGIVVIKED